MIYVLPPDSSEATQQKLLESLVPEIKEAQELLLVSPTRIGLHGEGKMVQFESKKEGATLKPFIITVIPHIKTDFRIISPPDKLAGEIIGLDQFLGIMDEIDSLDELSEFLDYVASTQGSFAISPMISSGQPVALSHFFQASTPALIPRTARPTIWLTRAALK